MFIIPGEAIGFRFCRNPEKLGINKVSTCSTNGSDPNIKESIDYNEKQDQGIIDEYFKLSKKRRYTLEELLPLAALKEGQKGKIVIAVGDRKLISRLCDLGLTPETQIKVLKKGLMEGPMILEVRSCEIAVGREIASKVLVKPL